MRTLKIILSVLFVLVIASSVAKGCHPRKSIRQPTRKPVIRYEKKTPLVPAVSGPRLAIILDDWGINAKLTGAVFELGRPITLSVLPHLRHSRFIAEEAHRHGLGVMLHMPMEPKIVRDRLEPQTILTTTTDTEIVRFVDEALAGVPCVEGVNNHMGSAATGDMRVMRTLIGHLKIKGLYYVDSKVIPSTVSVRVAREAGVPFAVRDVFIDNQLTLEAIKDQMAKAIRIASSRGQAIAIGHDHKITLAAIKEMLPEIDRAGVRLVLVKELLET